MKHFSVIPWVDYSSYGYGTPQAAAGGGTTDQSVVDDAVLFWNPRRPSPTASTSRSASTASTSILAALIGILGTLNKGSDRIQDNSQTFSISFDTRGG